MRSLGRVRLRLAIAAWILLGLSGPGRAGDRKVVHSELSPFGYVYVVDEGEFRYLRFDEIHGDDQSMMSLPDPAAVPMDYIRCAAVGLACLPDEPGNVLMIGLGGGSFTNLVWRAYPKLRIDVVEINPVVVRVARRFFGVPREDRYRIHVQDGRKYLESVERRYDLVFVDAYSESEDMPAHMDDAGFFELVRRRLRPAGVAVVNLSAEPDQESRVLAAFGRTFAGTVCLETPDENLILIARRDGRMPAIDEIARRASALARDRNLPFDLGKVATRLGRCPVRNEAAR